MAERIDATAGGESQDFSENRRFPSVEPMDIDDTVDTRAKSSSPFELSEQATFQPLNAMDIEKDRQIGHERRDSIGSSSLSSEGTRPMLTDLTEPVSDQDSDVDVETSTEAGGNLDERPSKRRRTLGGEDGPGLASRDTSPLFASASADGGDRPRPRIALRM